MCLCTVGCDSSDSYIDWVLENEKPPTHIEKIKLKSKDKDCKEEVDAYNDFYTLYDFAFDFEITDYKDGVCINRYIGDKEYVEIPETIGGRPVLKLGLFVYQQAKHVIGYSIYKQRFSPPFVTEEMYDYLDWSEYDFDDNYYHNANEEYNECYGFSSEYCLVKKIKIPKTVECISNVDLYTVAFEVDEENPYFSSIDGSLCSKDGKELFKYNYWNETVKIPDGIVTVYNGSLPKKKVYIPVSVENFYNYKTFVGCEVDESNKVYSSAENGSLLSKDGKLLLKNRYAFKQKIEKTEKHVDTSPWTESHKLIPVS